MMANMAGLSFRHVTVGFPVQDRYSLALPSSSGFYLLAPEMAARNEALAQGHVQWPLIRRLYTVNCD